VTYRFLIRWIENIMPERKSNVDFSVIPKLGQHITLIAALPHSLRKASGFSGHLNPLIGARLCLAMPTRGGASPKFKTGDGKPEAFRKGGGTAAEFLTKRRMRG
jgi:hypothetical protein